MEPKEIIGIDHGNKNMKSIHSVFESAISKLQGQPGSLQNVLEYQGQYFFIGGTQIEEKIDKTADDDFYFLTLVSLARELSYRGKRKAVVRIAAGLPPRWYISQRKSFREYLMRKKELYFKFEGIPYQITLESADVYLQGFSAISSQLSQYDGFTLLVDIGGGTVDLIPIEDGIALIDKCKIDTGAAIKCINMVNESAVAAFGYKVPTNMIEKIMRAGTMDCDPEYLKVIQQELCRYANEVYRMISGFGYNLKLTKLVFLGGGASVIKHFGDNEGRQVSFITDISANAKGYEDTGKKIMQARMKKQAG